MPADTVRVWVPGCATGEEAYSLAILLREYLDMLPAPPKVQVFATDIDEAAIATARAGRYPAALLRACQRRGWRASSSTQDAATSSARRSATLHLLAHSLIRDPPFSRIDLVSCRNLLIYLDTELHQVSRRSTTRWCRAASCCWAGRRHVGRTTSCSSRSTRRTASSSAATVPSPPLPRARLTRQDRRRRQVPPRGSPAAEHVAEGAIADGDQPRSRTLRPAFAVVSADGDVDVLLQPHRPLSWRRRPGRRTSNLFDAWPARGLRIELRTALRQAVETGRPVEWRGIAVGAEAARSQTVRLTVEPLPGSAGRAALSWWCSPKPARQRDRNDPGAAADARSPRDGRSHQLERDLRDTREQLQSITEEHETALEELRSANEELQSVNEELQSTNEELETSKEEIQSINEELQTVNAELAAKVEELDRANSDLRNMFESTQVATVFLDRNLIIRGFTPAIASIYNLIPSDHGRPLTDIASHLGYDDLRDDGPRAADAGAAGASGDAPRRARALPHAHPALPRRRQPRGRRASSRSST